MRGFTVVELLVTSVILIILVMMATYAYTAWVSYATSKRSLLQLTSTITAVENFSLSSGRAVTLCKSKTGWQCDGVEWAQGWLVFFDDDNRHQVAHSNDRLRVLPAIGTSKSFDFYGFPSSNYWQYQPQLSKEQQNGTFIYCDLQHTHHDWRVVISKTGRYRLEYVRDERCQL